MNEGIREVEKYWKCWRLITNNGRQYWEFDLPSELSEVIKKEDDWNKPEAQVFLLKMGSAFYFDKTTNPNSGDRVLRFLKTETQPSNQTHNQAKSIIRDEVILAAAKKGFDFYSKLQTDDGNWPGDYGGPLFLTPGLVIVSYITQTPLSAPVRSLIIRYFLNHQNHDGGWGLHIEDRSTMFGTVLQYVSLRLLGIDKNSEEMTRARNWIINNGGATHIPAWGKFYLSVLGVYEWKGCNSLFPELWILPKKLPIHPSKYWSHCRLVYLPMSYCYAIRLKAEESALIEELKEELYPIPYSKINWRKAKFQSSESDTYYRISNLFKFFQRAINFYEKIHLKSIRKKALNFMLRYMEAEDLQTNYINIGPVNQVINSLCMWHVYGKDSMQFKKHVDRWKDFLWVAEDGIKMNGYNGSQLWDTCFAGQALVENKLENQYNLVAKKIYHYLDITQCKEDVVLSSEFFRSVSKGTWPFSTAEQAWPVTDCTSEAIKTALLLEKIMPDNQRSINKDRLLPSVDMLLAYQNKNGGWASYEEIRGPEWLEYLNPAEIFGEIMVEHAYIECTSATIQGLSAFIKRYPEYRSMEIQNAIEKGKNFILSQQNNDGSWYGSWAICFTYGTWFAVEGLVTAGLKTYEEDVSPEIKSACNFLVSKQNDDGSWGESFQSNVLKKYIPHKEGQIIQTAWALLALMKARYNQKNIIEKGIQFILKHQLPDGDWPQQGISGVFNHNCMISYSAYRNVFPLMVLGRYRNGYLKN